MSPNKQSIKAQIVAALTHPEAEAGLYFDNLCHPHEEDERPDVSGTELEVLDALKELINEGKVVTDDSGDDIVFMLKS